MIKAIIFDMGGVLVDLDVEACRQAYKQDLGFEAIDAILDPCHQKGIFGEMEAGAITAEEFRTAVLAESRPDAGPEDVDKALEKILVGISPYKIDLLKELSSSYDIYMLSNNNPIATPMAKKMFADAGFDMEKDFRKCYISYQMKMMKPSQEFYKAVMDDIGIPPSSMLFIDDSRSNVEAALNAGLPAVYYEPGSDLAALIYDYLVRFGGEEVC